MSAIEDIAAIDNGLLRFLTCGSVDDGKSTLIGRLLYDSKAVLADALHAIERTSKRRGLGSIDLSLLTDGLQAEREQGITIDVAYRYFSSGRRNYVIADAPGHEQMNDIGKVSLKLAQPLCADSYAINRTTGAFILIDEATNNTVAAGMIL